MMEKITRTNQPTNADLQPGGMSHGGFLNKDQTLEQVINRDKRVLTFLGYTTQELADLLGPVTEMASKKGDGALFEYSAPVSNKSFLVSVSTYMGMQSCPWKDKVDWQRSNNSMDMFFREITEENLETIQKLKKMGYGIWRDIESNPKEYIKIAGLMRHLIEAHDFFEGGLYRIAPETIVQMFGKEKVPNSFEKVRELGILKIS